MAWQSLDFDSSSGKRFVPKMYKFTTHLTNSHLVLIRKKLSNGSCAALVVMRAPVRRYANEASGKPPTPKAKSRKALWGAVGATVAIGSAVVYAKHTPEVRNWLASNLPWADDFVGIVYQENSTYYQFFRQQLSNMGVVVSEFVFGKEDIPPLDFKQRSEQNIEEDATAGFKPKAYELPEQSLGELYVEPKVMGQAEVEHEATLVQTEGCDPPGSKPEPTSSVSKELFELENSTYTSTKEAVDGYKLAAKLCADYNNCVTKLVQAELNDLDKKVFTAMSSIRKERDAAIKVAKAAKAKAYLSAEELLQEMATPGSGVPAQKIVLTKRRVAQFRADVQEAEQIFVHEFERTIVSDRFWDKVDAARKMFKAELETLFPGIDLCARKIDPTGDTDLLLIYTMRQVSLLQNEIAELQTIREHTINKAIECNEEKALIEAKVQETVKREALAKELEFQKKVLKIMKDHQDKMKEELRKQYELQEDVMKKRLEKKEKEIMGKFNKAVSEKVEKDRIEYKKELAAMAGKLKAIEQTLKQRAQAEASAKRSQSIWTAAEALLAATRRAQPSTKIDSELEALEKAGKDDKLVSAVLGAISKEARQEGIVTEKSLKDRFEKLEKTAMKVALIGRDGASLPVYFLSWLQSKLIFSSFASIPQDELNDLPTDFSKLDTFDIISRAKYHMDHGDLPATLRYVNLLQGAPRAAAAAWASAARRHLEVRQAAETVMAHASLSAMVQEPPAK